MAIDSTSGIGTTGVNYTPLEEILATLTPQPKSVDQTPPPAGTEGPGTGGATVPLLDPPKMMSIEDMILAIQALKSKVMDEQAVSSKEEIKSNLAKKTNENEERIKKLEEAIEKMADAKKSGVFGKVFGWIATIAALIVAAALIATGVGVVAGTLMIASAVIGLGMQVFNEAGGQEWMAKTFGDKAATAFQWAMMGIQIALALGSLGAGLASSSATIAAKLPILAKTMGGFVQAGTSLNTAVTTAKVVSGVVQGVATVGQGASGISTGVATKKAEDARADAKEIEAAMLKLQAMLEEELKRLKKMLDEMQEGVSIAMQILATSTETKSSIIQNV